MRVRCTRAPRKAIAAASDVENAWRFITSDHDIIQEHVVQFSKLNSGDWSSPDISEVCSCGCVGQRRLFCTHFYAAALSHGLTCDSNNIILKPWLHVKVKMFYKRKDSCGSLLISLINTFSHNFIPVIVLRHGMHNSARSICSRGTRSSAASMS